MLDHKVIWGLGFSQGETISSKECNSENLVERSYSASCEGLISECYVITRIFFFFGLFRPLFF